MLSILKLLSFPGKLIGLLFLVVVAILTGAILYTPSSNLSPQTPRDIDRSDRPSISYYTGSDGGELAYRVYPAAGSSKVIILIHGSATESSVMNGVAKALNAHGFTVYSPDIRGHGYSGKRGDIAYIGQLDDDLTTFMRTVVGHKPDTHYTMIGFSAGAMFTLRTAANANDVFFDNYILLSPAIVDFARPGNGGWSTFYFSRIVGLTILNILKIHTFEYLPTVVWAIPVAQKDFTSSYSYRLMMNFNLRGYQNALKTSTKPITILAGAKDEQFYSDQYQQTLMRFKSDLKVKLIDNLGHVDMLIKQSALDAIVDAATTTAN